MASAEKTTESSRQSYRRTRRRHERQNSADITPTTSVPSTPRSHKQSQEATTSSRITTNGSTTFEEGEDFIPFVISDPLDDEPGPSRRRTDRTNERYRENEKNPDRDATTAAEDRHDGKNGHRRDRKRKYEEHDDEYSYQKQRAQVGSRKCPWVAGLELDRCLNVAEM